MKNNFCLVNYELLSRTSQSLSSTRFLTKFNTLKTKRNKLDKKIPDAMPAWLNG